MANKATARSVLFPFFGGQKDRAFLETEKDQKILQWLQNRGTFFDDVFSCERINGHWSLLKKENLNGIFQLFTPLGYALVGFVNDTDIDGVSIDIPSWDLELDDLDILNYPTVDDFYTNFEIPKININFNPKDSQITNAAGINTPKRKPDHKKLEDYYDKVCYLIGSHLSEGQVAITSSAESQKYIVANKLPSIPTFLPFIFSSFQVASSPAVSTFIEQKAWSGQHLFVGLGSLYFTGARTYGELKKAKLNLKNTYTTYLGKTPEYVEVYYQGFKTKTGVWWSTNFGGVYPGTESFTYSQIYAIPEEDENGDRLIQLEPPFPQAGGIIKWIDFEASGEISNSAMYQCAAVGFCYLYKK